MFRTNSYSSNSSSNIIIHEHDFVPIRLKEKQKSIICLTCGSFYCEKCGKLLVSTTIGDRKLIQHSNTL